MPTQQSKTPDRLLIWILVWAQLTLLVDFMVIVPLGESIMKSLSLSTVQFGIVAASASLCAGFSGLIFGHRIDRWPRRQSFLVFYAGFLLGTAVTGVATTFALLVIGRAIAGFFSGLFAATALALIGDHFPPNKQGQVTGVVMSAFGVACIVGTPFSVLVGIQYGWQLPIYVIVLVGGVNWLTAMGLLWHNKQIGQCSSGSDLENLQTIYKNNVHTQKSSSFTTGFYELALIAVLVFSAFLVIPFLAPFLTVNLRLSEAWLPWVYAVGGLFTILLVPAGGRVADRIGISKTLVGSILISAVLVLTNTILPKSTPYLAILVIDGYIVFNTLRVTLAITLLNRSSNPMDRGRLMAWSTSIQHFAGAFGALAGGAMLFRNEGEELKRFGQLSLICAVLSIASLALVSRINRRIMQ